MAGASATQDLSHLKEENVLLQAQVDQVTASLLETREAKQESEQQLQKVKQVDSLAHGDDMKCSFVRVVLS